MPELPTSTSRTAEPSSTAWFFIICLGFTFGLQAPAVLAKYGWLAAPPESLLPLAGLGGFGPLVGAMVATKLEGGRLWTLFARLRPPRVSLGWYVVAVLLSGALLASATAAYKLFGGPGEVAWWYPPREPQRMVALLIVPLVEEVGWRGYALPRMERRYGRLGAAIALGVLWTSWHLFMFLWAELTWTAMLASLPLLIAGSVGFSWLYHRTGSSLLMMVIAHVGVHLDNSHLPLPSNELPLYLHTGAWVVFALAVVFADPKTWTNPHDTCAKANP